VTNESVVVVYVAVVALLSFVVALCDDRPFFDTDHWIWIYTWPLSLSLVCMLALMAIPSFVGRSLRERIRLGRACRHGAAPAPTADDGSQA